MRRRHSGLRRCSFHPSRGDAWHAAAAAAAAAYSPVTTFALRLFSMRGGEKGSFIADYCFNRYSGAGATHPQPSDFISRFYARYYEMLLRLSGLGKL